MFEECRKVEKRERSQLDRRKPRGKRGERRRLDETLVLISWNRRAAREQSMALTMLQIRNQASELLFVIIARILLTRALLEFFSIEYD